MCIIFILLKSSAEVCINFRMNVRKVLIPVCQQGKGKEQENQLWRGKAIFFFLSVWTRKKFCGKILKKVGRKGIQEQSVNDELPLDNSRDKLRRAQECPGARNSNHTIFSRKPSFLILSNFPEEYFSDLTEYCSYRSRKNKMVESKLDFLRGEKKTLKLGSYSNLLYKRWN